MNTTTSALQNTHRHQRWQACSLLASNTCQRVSSACQCAAVRLRAISASRNGANNGARRRRPSVTVPWARSSPCARRSSSSRYVGRYSRYLSISTVTHSEMPRDALRNQPRHHRRRAQRRGHHALAAAPVAAALDHPPIGAHPQSPTARSPHCRARDTRRRMRGSGAAPGQRRVLRPAPAGVRAGAGPWPGAPGC